MSSHTKTQGFNDVFLLDFILFVDKYLIFITDGIRSFELETRRDKICDRWKTTLHPNNGLSFEQKGKTIKFSPLHALLIALGKPNSNYRPESSSIENAVLFLRNTGICDASLVFMKEKNGRFIALRVSLRLLLNLTRLISYFKAWTTTLWFKIKINIY